MPCTLVVSASWFERFVAMVVKNAGSSPIAAANSFKVFNAFGAPSNKEFTAAFTASSIALVAVNSFQFAFVVAGVD